MIVPLCAVRAPMPLHHWEALWLRLRSPSCVHVRMWRARERGVSAREAGLCFPPPPHPHPPRAPRGRSFAGVRTAPATPEGVSDAAAYSSLRPTSTTTYPPGARAKRYRVVPVADLHSLTVFWPVAPEASGPGLYRTGPMQLVAGLLGSESTGSLLARLKADGVAHALQAGVDIDLQGFGVVSCRCGRP